MYAYGRIAVALAAALAMSLVSTAQACIPSDRAALLILDASYSMLRPIGRVGPTRFSIARQAVVAVVDNFPDDGFLALRFYGSQTASSRNACSDTNLAVAFAPAGENRDEILLALAGAHARGRTPIAYALEQAVYDFSEVNVGKLIIIVSDGMESCYGDPCAAATALGEQGFIIHTVGFLVDRASQRQLQCIADVTGGTYFDAPVAIVLSDKLREAFSACPVARGPGPIRPETPADFG